MFEGYVSSGVSMSTDVNDTWEKGSSFSNNLNNSQEESDRIRRRSDDEYNRRKAAKDFEKRWMEIDGKYLGIKFPPILSMEERIRLGLPIPMPSTGGWEPGKEPQSGFIDLSEAQIGGTPPGYDEKTAKVTIKDKKGNITAWVDENGCLHVNKVDANGQVPTNKKGQPIYAEIDGFTNPSGKVSAWLNIINAIERENNGLKLGNTVDSKHDMCIYMKTNNGWVGLFLYSSKSKMPIIRTGLSESGIGLEGVDLTWNYSLGTTVIYWKISGNTPQNQKWAHTTQGTRWKEVRLRTIWELWNTGFSTMGKNAEPIYYYWRKGKKGYFGEWFFP